MVTGTPASAKALIFACIWHGRTRQNCCFFAVLGQCAGRNDHRRDLRQAAARSGTDFEGAYICRNYRWYKQHCNVRDYRSLPINTFYSHTLPPNWNRKSNLLTTQRYNCGTTAFTLQHHMAASSFHTGGVNACYADGSIRFVSESVDFVAWQATGSRASGEINVIEN